jgi:hypothetical protein
MLVPPAADIGTQDEAALRKTKMPNGFDFDSLPLWKVRLWNCAENGIAGGYGLDSQSIFSQLRRRLFTRGQVEERCSPAERQIQPAGKSTMCNPCRCWKTLPEGPSFQARNAHGGTRP